MVAKSDILTAKRRIEEELLAMLHHGTCDKVHVFESEWGHLRALVGSDAFKDMNAIERQKFVWKHLRENLEPENLFFTAFIRWTTRSTTPP